MFGYARKRLQSTVGYRSVIFIDSSAPKIQYFEVQLITDGYIRIGIATEQAEVNGPIGIDKYGYSFGSKNGYMFHNGKRTLFAERVNKDSIISCLFFSETRKLIFFVNGECVGKEIEILEDGQFWPAVSTFKSTIADVFQNKNLYTFKDKIFRKYLID